MVRRWAFDAADIAGRVARKRCWQMPRASEEGVGGGLHRVLSGYGLSWVAKVLRV